ncbi:head GIN domain-containing protein [uncultured Algoriphagus sp.]|uniref:head GIN domain-containing protein n=1 Tax=uncultured Algoriphagus sp. TaxID=417365 RepID=UPI0025865BC2|nr:head GIN domain-containing protein [uncultured Algoriphagus sp.]
MNLIKTTAAVLLLFLLGFSANAQGTETRTPGAFTSIESGGNWNVYVSIEDRDEVTIESGNIALNKVITEVKDGKLKLKLEKGNYRNVKLDFYVTVRELTGLGSSGSGSIIVEDDVETKKMNLGVSGSGLVQMRNVFAETVNVGISGSGDVKIEGGETKKLLIGQSGSGDFSGPGLVAEQINVGKSGSGKSYVGECKSLKVGASGSGNVYYKGNPELNVGVSGSARVIKQ